MRLGMSVEEIHEVSKIDPWFLERLAEIVALEAKVRAFGLPQDADNLRALKAAGFSDVRLAALAGMDEEDVAALRKRLGVAAGLQAHRHLRGRIRLADRLHVFDLRGAVRRQARAARRSRPGARRSSFSAAARTASARASSSTIAAATPVSRCARRATKRS